MTRRTKLLLGLGCTLVALNVVLTVVAGLSGGQPGGAPSSSYATGADGTAAYADLLRGAGHEVRALREAPATDPPSPADTAILLDTVGVTRDDAEVLRAFVEDGGRLVVGGDGGRWLPQILDGAPRWNAAGDESGRSIVPVGETSGVSRITGAGVGAWEREGAALPVLVGKSGPLLVVADVGRGRVALLADTSPLTNELLTQADNAALGLALAGPASRAVVFAESFHGAGGASGLSAIPDAWLAALGIAAFACAALMIARGRRFGPPEPDERELAPARVAYVEAVGALLGRGRDRASAVAALRDRAAVLTVRTDRAGGDDVLASFPEILTTDEQLVAAGRILAELERSDSGRRNR